VLAIKCCVIGAGSTLLEAHGARHGDRQLFIGLAVVILVAGALLVLRPLWAALAGRGLLWTTLAMTTLGPPNATPPTDSLLRPERE